MRTASLNAVICALIKIQIRTIAEVAAINAEQEKAVVVVCVLMSRRIQITAEAAATNVLLMKTVVKVLVSILKAM